MRLAQLSHPERRRILAALAVRPHSPSELADPINHPLGVVSYHFRELARARLIVQHDTETVRGAIRHIYRINAKGVGGAIREMEEALRVLRADDDARTLSAWVALALEHPAPDLRPIALGVLGQPWPSTNTTHGEKSPPAMLSRQRRGAWKPRVSTEFPRAADGTRTHDLLHGKQTL